MPSIHVYLMENYSSKFMIMSFGALAQKFLAESDIPKKSLDLSLKVLTC